VSIDSANTRIGVRATSSSVISMRHGRSCGGYSPRSASHAPIASAAELGDNPFGVPIG
jgi:hypothetical protein